MTTRKDPAAKAEALTTGKTVRELLAIWRLRDTRYGQRRISGIMQPITAAEEQAILAWRKNEMEVFPLDDRDALILYMREWTRPFFG